MINERDNFTNKVNELLDKPYGLDVYCWLRSCTSDYMEAEAGARGYGLEEIGSSDVSNKMFDLWRVWTMDNDRRVSWSPSWLCDSFGHWIQRQIIDDFDDMYIQYTFDRETKEAMDRDNA